MTDPAGNDPNELAVGPERERRRHVAFDFSGSVVFVGGGGTGIGRAIASQFVNSGAAVIVAGRREGPLQDFCDSTGGQASYVSMDTTSKADCERAIATVIERHGRLDVLVNNSLAASVGVFHELDEDALRAPTDTMLVGAALLTQAAIPHLVASKGAVINLSSAISRVTPYPSRSTSMYAAAKAGLNHLTRHLAAEYGPQGVRFNCVAPGSTRTEATAQSRPELAAKTAAMTPLGRMGEPEDIASVVLFLASDGAAWVTGEVITASGGMLAPGA